jgi:DNA helicase-2/ATP-dependent DNA helicase PcrA
MDFDDLLMLTVNLFQGFRDVLDSYRQRFRHVLVDEYQDTNKAQNELVLLLAAEHRNVCVVGDADQSIYGWRSADFRNILEFEKVFPEVEMVKLEQNYRSTSSILDAANALIEHNVHRVPKALWTDQGSGFPLCRYHAEDERDEASWVAGEIERLRRTEGLSYGDIAVFYRTNAQSRVLEESLVHRDIAYKVVGGTRFYDRREVKDVLAYLRVLVNPSDEVSFRRIVNVPRRGIGDASLDKLGKWARASGLALSEAVSQPEDAGLSGRAAKAAQALAGLLVGLRAEMEEGMTPGELVEAVGERTGYREERRAERTIEAEGRLENLAELSGVAGEHEDVQSFLENAALVADSDEIDLASGNVSLMTVHTAKGLEFPAVFLVGMEDGVFPHFRSIDDPLKIEEERRLCYVGMTRARRFLYISHAWSRTLWGKSSYAVPSRFLAEIPSEHVRDAAPSYRRR